jgi:hypothetical protein
MYGSTCCDREYATKFSSCDACPHDGKSWSGLIMFVWISTRAAYAKVIMNPLFVKNLVKFLN